MELDPQGAGSSREENKDEQGGFTDMRSVCYDMDLTFWQDVERW